MKNKLFLKIYIPILSIMISILFLYGYVNFNDQKNSYLKIMETQTEAILKSNILLNIQYILSDDKAQLISKSIELLKDNNTIKYLIFDKNNDFKLNILKDKFTISDFLEDEFKNILDENIKYKILKSKLYEDKVFHYIYEIKISKYKWGFVHIGISLNEYYNQLSNIYKKFLLITFFSIFILAIIIYYFVRWITIPITELTLFVNKISKGEFIEIDDVGDDEISQLKKDFNVMVRYLKKSKQQEVLLFQQTKIAHMSDMLNNIAHQWRQPLSVITVGLSGIKLKKDLNILTDEDFNSAYDLIMKNTNSLTETIDIFNKHTEKENFIEVIYANKLVKDIILLNNELLQKNFINIELKLLANDITMETIPNILSQVITNILLNAKKVFKKNNISKKIVEISLIDHKDTLCINIEDNAGNLDDTTLDKIFEPYFTGNTKYKGVGIGLFLSFDMIIKNLKGTLSIENGKSGARFTIFIPKSIK